MSFEQFVNGARKDRDSAGERAEARADPGAATTATGPIFSDPFYTQIRSSDQAVSERAFKQLRHGTPMDSAWLVGSAVTGVVVGYLAQHVTEAELGPLPVPGLVLAGAGVIGGLAMGGEPSTARNSLVLGGTMALVGALARQHLG